MKVLVLCHPSPGATRRDSAHAQQELAALRALRDRGELLEAYSPGSPGTVLIFAGPDAVDAALASLPLVQYGLIETEQIALRPFPLGD